MNKRRVLATSNIKSGASTSMLSETDYRIWVMIGHTMEAIRKARGAELAEYGITAVEASALYIISDIGPVCTPADIARKMAREHSTVLALTTRMEKKGLITRVKDSGDRSWNISLTEMGKITRDKASKLGAVHYAMSALSETDKRNLEDYLVALYEKASSRLFEHQLFQ